MERIEFYYFKFIQNKINWVELLLALNLMLLFVWPLLGNIIIGLLFVQSVIKYGIPKLNRNILFLLLIPLMLGVLSFILDLYYYHIDNQHYIRLIPFILFPIIFFTRKIKTYSFGEFHVFFSTILSLVLISYTFSTSKILAPTLSTNSIFADGFLKLLDVHASYISIYFISAILFIKKTNKNYYLLSLGLLVVSVFLSASKINLLFLVSYFIVTIIINKKYFYLIYLGVALLLLSVFAKYTTGGHGYDPLSRIKGMTAFLMNDGTYDDSTNGRLIVWSNALKLINDKPLFGYGTSYGHYLMRNSKGNEKKELNTHNQFLQNTINNGLFGLLGLMIFLFVPILLYKKSIDYTFISIIFLISMNLFVENLFDRHWGVMLVSFFMSYIYTIDLISREDVNDV